MIKYLRSQVPQQEDTVDLVTSVKVFREVSYMKWNEMSVFQKIIYVVGFLFSIAAIVLCVLFITDRLENGLSYALLSLASNNLCICVQNWKKKKGLAIFSLAVAAFVLVSQIYVLLIL